MSSCRQAMPRVCRLIVAPFLALALAFVSYAQEAHSEYEVKAAYLYRFASYVAWPEAPATAEPFVIGVMGSPTMLREVRKLQQGHFIKQRPVQVLEVTRLQDLGAARVLYVAAGHDEFLRAVSSRISGPLMTVTDEEDGLALGGVVNFVTVDSRVRFEVSLTAAEHAQLKVSADLLAVAIRVHGERATRADARSMPSPLVN
jgi:hypothetical protein